MSAQAEQASSAILWRAKIREPLRSADNDGRNTRQRLNIINDRRPAPQPDHCREGRPNARNATFAFERFHQRRFLADFIRARATVPIDFKVAPATENILAKKAFGVSV